MTKGGCVALIKWKAGPGGKLPLRRVAEAVQTMWRTEQPERIQPTQKVVVGGI